ncbi:DUF2637 domain-containing protein [Kitasatospora sp. NPDC093679]|uniref:DUF2637 domain-containing protein n=1 Tax=Kitasatospora sp. NPDC093679 TaxID=3154983 RepID=UPI00342F53AA
MNRPALTRAHYLLIAVIALGAAAIAAIGFVGSYQAVRDLAVAYGFGQFAPFVPIGIDAGIVVLLQLDLLLAWMRIPYPSLRRFAWVLTGVTIYLNARTATDLTGLVFHAVLPAIFVVIVEAARHSVARLAGIKAGQQEMEGLGRPRWFLSPFRTFALWRRKTLWGIASRDEALRLEQQRLIYRSRLRHYFGRRWKRRAPHDALTPLQLAQLGVPLHLTYRAGFAAAGVEAGELAVLFSDPAAARVLELDSGTETGPAELAAAEVQSTELETVEARLTESVAAMLTQQQSVLADAVRDALETIASAQAAAQSPAAQASLAQGTASAQDLHAHAGPQDALAHAAAQDPFAQPGPAAHVQTLYPQAGVAVPESAVHAQTPRAAAAVGAAPQATPGAALAAAAQTPVPQLTQPTAEMYASPAPAAGSAADIHLPAPETATLAEQPSLAHMPSASAPSAQDLAAQAPVVLPESPAQNFARVTAAHAQPDDAQTHAQPVSMSVPPGEPAAQQTAVSGEAASVPAPAARASVSAAGQKPTWQVTQTTTDARIPQGWMDGFEAFVSEHARHPSQEELAQYLYGRGLKARGKDEPVSVDSVRRYYGHLQNMFPVVDPQQLQLAGS